MSFWDDLVDDVGAFDAALAFIDDFVKTPPAAGESNNTAEAPEQDPMAAAYAAMPVSDIAAPAPTKPRRRRRDNVREEIARLKQAALALQQQYELLVPAQAQVSTTVSSAGPIPIDHDYAAESSWKGVAKAQFEAQQRALQENRRLRKSIERQLELAKMWDRLLKRGTSQWIESEVLAMLQQSLSAAAPLPLPDEPSALFQDMDDLQARVDLMYGQLDAVLADAQFANAKAPFRACRVQYGSPSAIECFVRELVPFEVDLTSKAIWQFLSQHFTKEDAAYWKEWQHVGPSEHFDPMHRIAQRYVAQIAHAHVRAVIDGRMVAQRYLEEEGRVVLVLTNAIVPHGIVGIRMDHVVVQRDVWLELQRAGERGTPAAATHVTAKFRASIALASPNESVSQGHATLRMLTEFMVAAINVRMDAGQQTLENLLLDYARQQQ